MPAFIMQFRKRISMLLLLLVVVLLLFIAVIAVFLVQPTVSSNDPSSIYKEQSYLDVLRRWYNYSDSGENDLNGPTVSMDDPKVIAKIRRKFLLPPSLRTEPYNLDAPLVYDTSMGQSEMILSILGEQKEGFFVECGAMDGETRSNTLYFESHLNWSGLLVEADPLNFVKMEAKKRKAYLSPSCLSIEPYPIMVSFKQAFNVGKISEYPPGYRGLGFVDVQCFPLYSYLLALNRTKIDYFSLDVEGSELDVLRTIPFEKLDIRNYKYLHELLEALVPVERSSTICGWNNRGQLLWDYLKIIGEVDTLLANQDLAAGYQLEKLQPQLSGLCARINMLPCPTAMDRLCQSEIAKRTVHVVRNVLLLQKGEVGVSSRVLAHLVTQLPLPEDYAQQELRQVVRSCVAEFAPH